MKYKKNELLVVFWDDAHTDTDWLSEEDAKKRPKDVDSISCGFFLKKDKELLFLSTSIGPHKNSKRDRSVIPLGCIQKVDRIKYSI